MSTEIRFLVAIVLMVTVLVVTNLIFPPVTQDEPLGQIPADSVVLAQPGAGPIDSVGVPQPVAERPLDLPGAETAQGAQAISQEGAQADPFGGRLTTEEDPEEEGLEGPARADQVIPVESPLYAYTFSSVGARLTSARLLGFPSFTTEGPVELVRPGSGGALGVQVLVAEDTLDLRNLPFEVEPREGLRMREGGSGQTLRFTYRHPTHPFTFQVTYTFQATNIEGDVWADPSGSYRTVGAPTVTNASPLDYTNGTATVGGVLTYGGNAYATVYWGLIDEGQNAAAWGNTTTVGQVIMGVFRTNITVGAGGTYYYRVYVTNDVDHA